MSSYTTHNAYAEIVHAGNQEIAYACGCQIGQYVGRVYPRDKAVESMIGTRAQAEKFVSDTMGKYRIHTGKGK